MERDEGSCTEERGLYCKKKRGREIWGGRQLEEQVEHPPPPPLHTTTSATLPHGGGLIGLWARVLIGCWRAEISYFASRARIIILFIIQSERLTTPLSIINDSPFNSPFEPPPSLCNPSTPPRGAGDGQMSGARCGCSVLLGCSPEWSETNLYSTSAGAEWTLCLPLSFKRGFSLPGAELYN